MSSAETVTDHAKIKQWAETHGGKPAKVRTKDAHENSGILRFEFRDPDDRLEVIEWDEFFKIFDDNKLALLESPDKNSKFAKFISR